MEYSAFAMRIVSDIPLDLPAADSRAEAGACGLSGPPGRRIRIVRSEVREEFASSGACEQFRFGKSDAGILVEVFAIGKFRITGDCLVEVDPQTGVAPYSLAHAIETIILSFVMYAEGIATLHGSAVARNGRAIVIAGESGSGKSTTAAELSRCGWSLLCDDLVPLSPGETDEGILVFPGIASPKLLPDAYARVAIPSRGGLPRSGRPHSQGKAEKRRYHAGSCDRPVPLAAIFCLEIGDTEEIVLSRLSGYQGTAALVRNLSSIPGLDAADLQLSKIHAIQSRTSLYRVVRPRGKDSLATVLTALGRVAEEALAGAAKARRTV
jgi:hypothetical protein